MTSLQLLAVVPGVVAIVVGVIEMRATTTRAQKIRALVPVGVALLLVLLLLLLGTFIDDILAYMSWLCGSMVVLGILVALSCALVKYSRRVNAVLMALVGVMLAYYWLIALPRT